jgi:anti-sigma regulatory factor (Ser/Thr protein kinase)
MKKDSNDQGMLMPTEIEFSFPATMSGLSSALATIEQFGTARNLNADDIARVRVVVEELASNTMKYGYGAECDRPIRLQLSAEPVLALVYEDLAGPFDPTLWRPKPEWAVSGRERPEGLAGIDLVLGLSSTVEYQATPDGNRLVMTFVSRAD